MAQPAKSSRNWPRPGIISRRFYSRRHSARFRRRHIDFDGLPGVDAIAGIADRAGPDRHRAVEDQRLEARARQRGPRGEQAVEPFARLYGGDGDRFALRTVRVHDRFRFR